MHTRAHVLSPAASAGPAHTLKRPSENVSEQMEPVKRSRLVWTRELHDCFVDAVENAGGVDVAVPKTVLEVRCLSGAQLATLKQLQHLCMPVNMTKPCATAAQSAFICCSTVPVVRLFVRAEEVSIDARMPRPCTEFSLMSVNAHSTI